MAELQARQERLGSLIQAVKDTIQAEERNEIMADEKKFEAFKQNAVEQYEQRFGQEARTLYGNEAVDAACSNMLDLTLEQYQEWTELNNEILQKLEQAVRTKLSSTGEEAKKIMQLHRRWLTISDHNYTAQKHKGLAELYVADERFTAYYDRNLSGCAQFLHDAIVHWAE